MKRSTSVVPVKFDLAQQMTRVYLTLPRSCSFEEWFEIGERLLKARDRCHFLLGDLMIEGVRRFGDQHVQLLDNRNVNTLRKAKWVCSRIPPERRHEKLSFSHHDAIASLEPDDQDELMAVAEKNRWDRERLREAGRERELLRRREQGLEPEVIPPARMPSSVRKAGARPGDSARQIEDVEEERPIEGLPTMLPRDGGGGYDTDQAATYLRSIAGTAASPALKGALTTLLEERSALLRMLETVKRSVEVGTILPELRAQVVPAATVN